MEEVETIFNDCEELIHYEIELQTQINQNQKLITGHQQVINQITYNISTMNINDTNDGKIQGLQGLLKTKLSMPQGSQQLNQTLIGQLISKLKETAILTSDEQEETIIKIKGLLGVKRIFLNTRQITIKGLQNCYNKLKSNKKYTKADEVGKIISAGGTVASSLTFGVPKVFGDTIIAINGSFKREFSDKREEEFQQLLINDKENLFLLNNDIVNKLNTKDKCEKLFGSKYKIFEIDSSIWEGKPISAPEEMEKVIILLDSNFKSLRDELEQEEKQFKEFSEELEQQQTNIEIPPK